MKTKRTKQGILGLIMAGIVLLVGISLIVVGLFVNKDVFETNKGVVDYTKINYGEVRQPTTIVFEDMGKEIGRLEWGTGEFQFIGNADMSAKVFFEYFLKPYIDGYIDEEVRRKDDKGK